MRLMSESDLVKGVRGWLEKQGYPLEMRVAAEFERLDFSVAQSLYYVAKDQPPRELDVFGFFSIEDARLRWEPSSPRTAAMKEALSQKRANAEKQRAFKHMLPDEDVYSIDACTVVECKSGSPKRPWIAFTAERVKPSLPEIVKSYPMTDLASAGFNTFGPKLRPDRMPLFSVLGRYAHAVVPASLGDKEKEAKADDGYDIAYSAAKKVAEAARLFVDQVNAGYGARMVRLWVPVVVVSTPLVECWLERGQIRIEERDEIVLRFDLPDPKGGARHTHVHLVHESALATFIRNVRATIGLMLENHSTLVDIIRDHNRRKAAAALAAANAQNRRPK